MVIHFVWHFVPDPRVFDKVNEDKVEDQVGDEFGYSSRSDAVAYARFCAS